MDAIANELKQYKDKKVLLLTHHNADPDALCSAIALSEGLAQLGIESEIGVVESARTLAQKVAEKLDAVYTTNPKFEQDLIVLLDTSTEGQLSKLAETFKQSGAKKMVIDHHTEQELTFSVDLKYVDEKASSTTEIVYELLEKLGVKITDRMAKAIVIGLVTDTAHFKFATAKNFRLIAKLLDEHSMQLSDILSLLAIRPHISEKIAVMKAVGRAETHRKGDYLIITSTVGSFEAAAARALLRVGADVAIVASVKGDELRVSMRSNHYFHTKTKIDLGKDVIPELKKLVDGSGSGHPTAAGFNGKNTKSVRTVLETLAKNIMERIKE